MLALVNKWKGSGMSLRSYSQKVGISKSKFEYWVRKENHENAAKNPYSQFIEVGSLTESPKIIEEEDSQKPTPPNPQIVLTFPSGLSLSIYS